ncbi:dynein axonemal assembly factor 3-like isoform X2 [Lampris incognitus]|nr:dynein axonemal assembly factor 3-like isoform X2 [Lampris incognitus]
MEVVARQLMLLYLALIPQESMGLHEKTEVFLEVFGNSEIRNHTEETVKQAASQLRLSVTNCLETPAHPCLDTTLLRYKERDELARIFKTWTQPLSSSGAVSITRAWDSRLRRHLGTRYDSRRGCFDWDLAMKLHQKGCGVINKQQYFQWRERGLAFEMREGVYQKTNPTLLSTRVFSHRGEKVAVMGYWGDIVSSPYLSFGIESDNKTLFQTQNGQHVKTAQDFSFTNIEALFQSLVCRKQHSASSQPDTEKTTESEPSQTEAHHKSVTVNDLIHLDGVSVTFLPLDSLSKLPEKQKYSQLFNSIYFGASLVHKLDPALKRTAAPGAVLIVELAKYLLDLTKEQEAGFAEKVVDMAREVGFEPWREENSDDCHAVFTLPREETRSRPAAT